MKNNQFPILTKTEINKIVEENKKDIQGKTTAEINAMVTPCFKFNKKAGKNEK